jgi:hypothetical protein
MSPAGCFPEENYSQTAPALFILGEKKYFSFLQMRDILFWPEGRFPYRPDGNFRVGLTHRLSAVYFILGDTLSGDTLSDPQLAAIRDYGMRRRNRTIRSSTDGFLKFDRRI